MASVAARPVAEADDRRLLGTRVSPGRETAEPQRIRADLACPDRPPYIKDGSGGLWEPPREGMPWRHSSKFCQPSRAG